MLARMGDLNAHTLRTGKLTTDEAQRLVTAYDKADLPIFIVDEPRPSIDRIERIARSLRWSKGIEILFIDYLQLVSNSAYDIKRLQVADISARCKALARELNIPVVTLAQLNREADGRDPRLSDLKESGSIEEDADMVLMLTKDPAQPKRIKWEVLKNRDGETGFAYCNWNASRMRAY